MAATTVTIVSATSVAAAACLPARIGPHVDAAPSDWKDAAHQLTIITGEGNAPWSCSGGEIDLVARPDGAVLTVTTDDGRIASRQATSPEDVVPLGEALLARPLPSAAPAAAAPQPSRVAAEPDAAPAAPRSETEVPPRLFIDASIGPRLGDTNRVWGSAGAAVGAPFGSWFGGVWVRYDALSASLHTDVPSATELCAGISAGARVGVGRGELRASLTPSVAVIRTQRPTEGHETSLDGRIGADVRGVVPVSRAARAFVALDGDVAPAELGPGDTDAHRLPPLLLPAFTAGLSVGVELAIR